jgi:hypothetical protein
MDTFCQNCGLRWAESHVFCGGCGARREPAKPAKSAISLTRILVGVLVGLCLMSLSLLYQPDKPVSAGSRLSANASPAESPPFSKALARSVSEYVTTSKAFCVDRVRMRFLR